MSDTVLKVIFKKEAKVVKCQELLELISNNENVESFKVEIGKGKDYDLTEEVLNQYLSITEQALNQYRE